MGALVGHVAERMTIGSDSVSQFGQDEDGSHSRARCGECFIVYFLVYFLVPRFRVDNSALYIKRPR